MWCAHSSSLLCLLECLVLVAGDYLKDDAFTAFQTAINSSSNGNHSTNFTNNVLFVPLRHVWATQPSPSDRQYSYSASKMSKHSLILDNFPTSPSIHQVVSRPRRKVISRAGHYLVPGKGDGSIWGEQSSAGPGTYEARDRRYDSRDWNYRGHFKGLFAAGRTNGRYSSQNNRNYQGRRVSHKRNQHSRKKISQMLKMEIGQYALQKGAKEASDRYSNRVGRRLKERIIEKFARRYRLKQERRLQRTKEGKNSRYMDK